MDGALTDTYTHPMLSAIRGISWVKNSWACWLQAIRHAKPAVVVILGCTACAAAVDVWERTRQEILRPLK